MNVITLKYVEMRNFLSFGNTWQRFEFKNGVNIIQGFDDIGKSNGAGKSSLMETVPFALFGKTMKGVKAADIPNWHNNSKCEVKLEFSIGGSTYLFHRTLKPSKFVVYENNEQLPVLSNIRDFQKKIERDILGIDFKTFKNLVYFSSNSMVSILKSPKDVKRKFIESLFDLSEYSDMRQLCLSEVRKLQTDISSLDALMAEAEKDIAHLEETKDNVEIPDNTKYKKRLNMLKFSIETLESELSDYDGVSEEYENLKKHIANIEGGIREKESLISDLHSKKREIIIKKSKYNLDDIRKQNEKLKRLKNEVDMLSGIIDGIEGDIDLYIECKGDVESHIRAIKDKIESFKAAKTKLVTIIEERRITLDKLKNEDRLDDVVDCPLCKQKVNHSHISEYYDNKISEIESEINQYEKKLILVKKRLADTSELDLYVNILSNINKFLSCVDSIKDRHQKYTAEYKIYLENSLDIDEVEKELKEYDSMILELDEKISNEQSLLDLSNTDLNDKRSELESLKSRYDKYIQMKTELDKSRSELMYLKDTIQESKNAYNSAVSMIKSIEADINKKRKSILENKKMKMVKNRLIDHYEYLMVVLKDENIKQYAISSSIPFLNKRANYYLTNSGFPYTVNISGWLDCLISGNGVKDIDYDSLSGGERKSIDLALQFACNDLSSLQAKCSFNILILDEMIDSSFDEYTIENIMKIIDIRNKELNGSVYVITHKKEIRDFSFDSYIEITKRNGFSVIKEESINE